LAPYWTQPASLIAVELQLAFARQGRQTLEHSIVLVLSQVKSWQGLLALWQVLAL